jgi:hypothetical protein
VKVAGGVDPTPKSVEGKEMSPTPSKWNIGKPVRDLCPQFFEKFGIRRAGDQVVAPHTVHL